MEDFFEQSVNDSEKEEPEQIIEGIIKDINHIEDSLPKGISSDQVIPFIRSNTNDKWGWYLRPEFIKNIEKRKQIEEEIKKWDTS
jgi:hypothetical protein